MSALSSIGDATGGDGELSPTEFGQLYVSIFPDVVMDGKEQAKVSVLFEEVDTGDDGKVNLRELLDYLAQPSHQHADRPESLREWLWLLVSPFGRAGNYDPRLDLDSNWPQMISLLVYKFVEQIVIFAYMVILFVESQPSMQNSTDGMDEGNDLTFLLETICVIFFTAELVLYVFAHPRGPFTCAVGDQPETMHSPGGTKICVGGTYIPKPRHLLLDLTFYIDVLSIAPYYVEQIYDVQGVRTISTVRFVRVMRCLKLLRTLRMVTSPNSFVSRIPKLMTALKRSTTAIVWFITLLFVLVALCGTCVTYAERDQAHFDMESQSWIRDNGSVYDDHGQKIKFQSIPHSMWWTIVTVTTVGYGDMYPHTAGGKIVGTFTILSGLIVISFPITILGSVFGALHEEQQYEDEMVRLRRRFYRGMLDWFKLGGKRSTKSFRPASEIAQLGEVMANMQVTLERIEARVSRFERSVEGSLRLPDRHGTLTDTDRALDRGKSHREATRAMGDSSPATPSARGAAVLSPALERALTGRSHGAPRR